ncbi:hypothetical protein AVEN_269205-1 [Araneus ventricosus]|uniref:Uncharacterized protein n=1 Tax=Araneus ventricosus TaxID=182803 RepID=A0A4Y2N0L6_ARAVE|nr:hypothetical protein AVEN_269205-1 [Araneus ventricosus]
MHDVMPRFNPKEDYISLFLVLLESQAKIINILAKNQVSQLISLLPPDIVQLIAREPEEDAKKYDVLPLAEVEIKCELGHMKTKAALVTNDPGIYVLGNINAQLFKEKPFLKLEKINAIMTRSQAKRSSEEDRNKKAEMEHQNK